MLRDNRRPETRPPGFSSTSGRMSTIVVESSGASRQQPQLICIGIPPEFLPLGPPKRQVILIPPVGPDIIEVRGRVSAPFDRMYVGFEQDSVGSSGEVGDNESSSRSLSLHTSSLRISISV